MKIILEIDGWRKLIEVDDSVIKRGQLEVRFESSSPLLNLVAPYSVYDKVFQRKQIASVMFYYKGDTIDRIPFFEAA